MTIMAGKKSDASFCLSVCLSACLPACLPVCLSVCFASFFCYPSSIRFFRCNATRRRQVTSNFYHHTTSPADIVYARAAGSGDQHSPPQAGRLMAAWSGRAAVDEALRLRSLTFNNLGLLCADRGDLVAALEYLDRALDIELRHRSVVCVGLLCGCVEKCG